VRKLTMLQLHKAKRSLDWLKC